MSLQIKKSIVIAEPIWSSRSVGINLDGIGSGLIKVIIEYKDKKGEQPFPGSYLIDAKKARTYPSQRVRAGVKVFIVPIKDLYKWR